MDGAHLEFLRGIGNPLGVKISDKMQPSDLVTLINAVNPENVPGRLAVIVRMGAKKVRDIFSGGGNSCNEICNALSPQALEPLVEA